MHLPKAILCRKGCVVHDILLVGQEHNRISDRNMTAGSLYGSAIFTRINEEALVQLTPKKMPKKFNYKGRGECSPFLLVKIFKIHKELHSLFPNYSMALEVDTADRLKAVLLFCLLPSRKDSTT